MLKYLFRFPLLPLLGAAVNGLLGRRLRFSEAAVKLVACGATGLSCLLALGAIWEDAARPAPGIYVDQQFAYTWIRGGDYAIRWAYQMDPLAAVMTFIVTFVGLLIHVFATCYMERDAGS